MNDRPQFAVRENPASDRRHGSRFTVGITPNESSFWEETQTLPKPSPGRNHLVTGHDCGPNAASPRAATGEEKDDAAPSVRFRPSETTPHCFEPLIGSCEAARLLGNIHVKTLQRYARHKRVPGYQIAGHWYFRASELDSWLQSQTNSSRHPCRLQEKSDGA